MSAEAWTFLSVVVAQIGLLIGILIRQRHTHETMKHVEKHVNNVEEDIDHSTGDVTLGQRLKRMEESQQEEWVENKRVHNLILQAEPTSVISLFKAMYADSDVPVYVSSEIKGEVPPWSIRWVNKAWTKLTGFGLEGASTHQYLDQIHREDIERVQRAAADSFERQVTLDISYRHMLPEGHYATLFLRGEPVYNLSGNMTAQLGVIMVVDSQEETK